MVCWFVRVERGPSIVAGPRITRVVCFGPMEARTVAVAAIAVKSGVLRVAGKLISDGARVSRAVVPGPIVGSASVGSNRDVSKALIYRRFGGCESGLKYNSLMEVGSVHPPMWLAEDCIASVRRRRAPARESHERMLLKGFILHEDDQPGVKMRHISSGKVSDRGCVGGHAPRGVLREGSC